MAIDFQTSAGLPGSPRGERGARSGPVLAGEEALWSAFVTAGSPELFCNTWLALECRALPGITGGAVLLGEPDAGPYEPVASWPRVDRSLEHLGPAAERALRERRGVVCADATRSLLAYPLEVTGRLHGVVVLEAAPRPQAELDALLRQLHWGLGWMEVLLLRRAVHEHGAAHERLCTVLDLVALTLEERGFHAACMTLATELAARIACDRVSVGFLKSGQTRLEAISHTASFTREMNAVRVVEAAMDEAVDQAAAVSRPAPASDPLQPGRAHDELLRHNQRVAVLTVPLQVGEDCAGAITFERSAGAHERGDGTAFTADDAELAQGLAALVAPILDAKRREERWLGGRILDAGRDQAVRVLGPGHPVRKLAALLLVATCAFFTFATTEFRVTADSAVEGAVRRAVVAPFDGYIADASARAGDTVRAGERLSALDDRELALERVRWIAQRLQLVTERREAAGKKERARTRILDAQVAQADAQVALLDGQLARTTLTAPFDGVVVSGDLSQSLGSPVKRGDVLFELAPLDEYRIILEVDERDLDHVAVGQRGDMVLTALPGDPLAFAVTAITPVAVARDGRNFFRVEAALDGGAGRLRPGMAGIGKVHAGERNLAWVWGHRLVDWLVVSWWRWAP